MQVYRIRNWDQCGFEVSQNRRSQQALPWVAIPTKHDGKGFRKLMRHEDGTALYGCWILIVAVCGKSPVRGALIDSDGPLTAEDVSLKTDAPAELVQKTLDILCTEIGWMECVEVDSIDSLSTGRPPPVDSTSTTCPDTGRDGTGRTDVSNVRLRSGSDAESGTDASGVRDGPCRSSESEPKPPELPARGLPEGSVFASVTAATLADTGKLREWFEAQARAPSPVVRDSEAGWEFVVGASEVAQRGKVPERLFASIVGRQQVEKITTRAATAARRRIAEHRGRTRAKRA